MPRVPSRKALEDMKRTDIQQMCKDYGVRANLKTEVLIDMLLDASKPLPPKPAKTERPRTASSATRVSSRRTSGRSRGPSKGSVIIHDSEDEEDVLQEDERERPTAPKPDAVIANGADRAQSEGEPTPAPTPPLATRTRKAKETQTRLGKGRPVIAGGSGARAITKSISVSRGSKRGGRTSRSIQHLHETIPEEESELPPIAPTPPPTGPEASGSNHAPTLTPEQQEGSLAFLEVIDKRVADALRPLHEQMLSLKSEVERLKTQVSEMPGLEVKVQNLTAEVEGLRSSQATKNTSLEIEIGKLQEQWTRKNLVQGSSTGPGTPGKVLPGKYGSLAKPTGWNGPSPIAAAKASVNGKNASASGSQTAHATPTLNMELPHPGFAATVIGKRRRDSDASNVTGVIEEGHEDEFSETELEKRVIRPTKKRPRLDNEGTSEEHNSHASESQYTQGQQDGERAPAPRVNNFTVFSGPDEPDNLSSYIDPHPPTNHLPDFFAPSPDHANLGSNSNTVTQTSTAHASENQNPFGFNFAPMSSTPMHSYPLTMPSFPYPEPPTSPSPAGIDRTFHPFGLPPSRPRSGANNSRPGSRQGGGDGSGTVNPAALTRGQQEASSSNNNDLTVALGLTSAPIRMGESSTAVAAGPAKRTMYGTELDGDTRFGDFGMERVANGFWARGGFQR